MEQKVSRTLNGEVSNKVRSDILAGYLRPGTRLQPAELAHKYSVSLTVVREALARLAEGELVEWVPQTGFRVASLSLDDLSDLTDVRLDIETLAVRYAVQRGDLAWEAQVLAAHHTLDRTPQFDPSDSHRVTEEWAKAHADFHRACLEGCNSKRLMEISSQLRDGAELYRRWSHSLGDDSSRDVPGEHRALLRALMDRDEVAAVEVLRQHISLTTDVLLEYLQLESGRATAN